MKRFLLTTVLLVINICLASCSVMPKKEMVFRGSTLAEITPTVQVHELWSQRATSGAKKYYLRLTPVIVDQTIFVADYDGKVAAINIHNGETIWKRNTRMNLTSGIGAQSGKLFIATENGKVIALRQKDGKRLWKTSVGSEILATPTAVQGIVLAKSMDGSLTALSQQDGRQLWRYRQDVPSLILHIASQPKVSGNYVVAGFANGKLVGLDLHKGIPLWTQTITTPKGSTALEQMTDIDVSPVIKNDVIYIATYQGNIAALDLYSGKFLWKHKMSSHSGICADHHQIYLSDEKSYVWAFDQNTGAVKWRQTQLENRTITAPALYGQYVVVADAKGYLHWLSKQTGEFVARNRLDGSEIFTPPVAKNGILYVYTRRGYLYAFKV
jgi:outer membrane protein assembly factor BamB